MKLILYNLIGLNRGNISFFGTTRPQKKMDQCYLIINSLNKKERGA